MLIVFLHKPVFNALLWFGISLLSILFIEFLVQVKNLEQKQLVFYAFPDKLAIDFRHGLTLYRLADTTLTSYQNTIMEDYAAKHHIRHVLPVKLPKHLDRKIPMQIDFLNEKLRIYHHPIQSSGFVNWHYYHACKLDNKFSQLPKGMIIANNYQWHMEEQSASNIHILPRQGYLKWALPSAGGLAFRIPF
jgi:hypothetical protein